MPTPLNPTTGSEVRQLVRAEQLDGPTPGLAPGFVQANLVIVPKNLAFDFLLFCQRNPKPCPLLEVIDAGNTEPIETALHADVRTDVPRYCVYRNGNVIDEPSHLQQWWRDDLVTFLLGCSFTFENALIQRNVPVRHLEQDRNVPMYRTSIACASAGTFAGTMVVSMRPMTPAQALTATQICQRIPLAHGAPIHFGEPGEIGIVDVNKPDFGDPVEIRSGEVPVFWACGVTPQVVGMQSKPELLITHKPGHMLVTDLRDVDLMT